MAKKELAALSVWAFMIILVFGLYLTKPTTTGFATTGYCNEQAQIYCMNNYYGSSSQPVVDTNLCNGRTANARLFSDNGNHKFVFETGDVLYNTGNYVCVVCNDGRNKVFNKRSQQECGHL